MSITVASTTLDTSWAEFSTVGFTAGTLGTITECVTEVESKLKRGNLSGSTTPTLTQVQRWLIRGKQEIAEKKKFTWKRRFVTATMTAGTFRYSLPPDIGSGYTKIRDLTDNSVINLISNHQFDVLYPDVAEESNGQILAATIKNREIWFAPPPDGTNIIEIEYGRTGDDNTPTDFSWLPELERFRCCDFAIGESFDSLHMWQEAERYKNKWREGLAYSIKADAKKKYSQMGYRARSVFQA